MIVVTVYFPVIELARELAHRIIEILAMTKFFTYSVSPSFEVVSAGVIYYIFSDSYPGTS